jgi:photosystem II stability/assembly factor-like uncharacterized protein
MEMAGPDAGHPRMPARLRVLLLYGTPGEKFPLSTALAHNQRMFIQEELALSRRRSRILTIPSILVLLALASAAFAQPRDGWTPFGPGGGSVYSLTVDPRDPAVVYAVAGSRYGGPGTLYKSLDGGATWKTLAAGSGLQAVALDPEHPGTVYAGGSYLLRSTNGGRTWSDVSPHIEVTRITALAVTPGGAVFAGDAGRLLRSPDGGRTWVTVSQDVTYVLSILVSPADPNRVYHASQSALYKSVDGGAHWTVASPPDVSFPNAGFAQAPSAPERLYFLSSFDTRVLRSDDGAGTWRVVGEVPHSNGKVTLLVDPRSADRVYAASSAGLFTSADGGSTWREITQGLPRPLDQPLAITSLAASPSRPDTLYVGTEEMGVARSTDAGAHWGLGLETGLNAGEPALLKFHPLRPGTVYLGLGVNGTRSFRSTDGGRTWRGFARTITQTGWNDLAFDPDDPDLLYASTSVAIWKSADGGETWTRISDQVPTRLAALGRHTLLASHCGVSRSTDDGRTWSQVILCSNADGYFRTPISLWVDPRDSRNVYIHFLVEGGTHYLNFEVFRSRDGGATWTKPRALSFPPLFAVAPDDFRVLYAVDASSSGPRLLRSLDGGDHWQAVNRSLPINLANFFGSLAVDAADPDKLYVAASPLLISRDGGASFQSITTPFEAGKLGKSGTTRVWTDRTRPGLVYAASGSVGLFEGHFE